MTRRYSHLFTVAVRSAVYSGPTVAQQRTIEDLVVRAKEGDAEAQNELGSLYYAGEDVEQDDTEAVRWIKRAADQGYAPAQYNLGLLYFRSRGGLGYMLVYGAGVDEDYVLAYMWLELAGNGATSDFTRRLYAQQLDELAQRIKSLMPNASLATGKSTRGDSNSLRSDRSCIVMVWRTVCASVLTARPTDQRD